MRKNLHTQINFTFTVFTFLCSCFFFNISISSAQGWSQKLKQIATDGEAEDNYGKSVSIYGDYAIIGAWADDDNGSNAGAAYLLARNQGGTDNWGMLKKLTASDGAAGDAFGHAVFISGDYVIVGAHEKTSGAGAVYIFKKDEGGTDNWGEFKILVAADADSDDYFGASLSLNGDHIIVGAYGDDDKGSESGSAYIFEKDEGGADNWGQLVKLTESTGAVDDNFGFSVSIFGTYAAIGSKGDDSNTGSVFIHSKDQGGTDNWGMVKKLNAADANPGDNFGVSVSISLINLAVGADGDSSNKGAAYTFFRFSNWGQVAKVTGSDGVANDFFGRSVSIENTDLVVGAPGNDSNKGAAYFYEQNFGGPSNWGQLKKVTAADAAIDDQFGESVSINSSNVFAGAYEDDDKGSTSGSAYWLGLVCDPSLATIASTTGQTGSDYVNTDANGWTHYCSCTGELLLSLKTGSSGAVIPVNGISVETQNPIASFYEKDCGVAGDCFIKNPTGAVIFNRSWEVAPNVQPSPGQTVDVRFYFTDTEFDALNAELTNQSLTPLSTADQLSFYKVTNDALGNHPAVNTVTSSDVVLLINDATPSTSKWMMGMQGATDYYAEFKVTSFSGGGGGAGSNGSALPVELLHFRGKYQKTKVILDWATASEVNNRGFVIERAGDVSNWEEIGFVDSRGNSTEQINYTFIDSQPLTGNSYYRLRQVDFNNEMEYSNLVHIFKRAEIEVGLITPNPINFGKDAHFQIYAPGEQKAMMSLHNNIGQLVLTQQLYLDEGLTIANVPSSKLSAGIYHLKVEANGKVFQQKMVISKE